MSVREPAVAGKFYEGTAESLAEQVESVFAHGLGPGAVPTPSSEPPAIDGLVSPHAGLPYSGPVAAHGFSELATAGRPDVLVIVGPNHTGVGDPVGVSPASEWRTPLGRVPLHDEVRQHVLEAGTRPSLDQSAHRREHSIEVQLPFLQTVYDDPPAIVPISMGDQGQRATEDLASAIATAADAVDESVVPVASTDLTHYESQSVAETADRRVIERIEALDAAGLLEVVERESISMCGYGPTAAVIGASERLGAETGHCLKYATSGDVTGGMGDVVGYCSAVLS